MDGLGESFLRRSRGGARSATGQDRLGEIVYWARSAGRDRAAATSDGEIGGFRWRDRLGEIKTASCGSGLILISELIGGNLISEFDLDQIRKMESEERVIGGDLIDDSGVMLIGGSGVTLIRQVLRAAMA
ncbi:hypothetical protein SO802_029289 [Lithocarpus litseifolius]|uniref:Uncharacterized protein n=1 Tax=Lithocarpus litseifolius TaxID=425828 RepID=A0AAW2BVY5_9ROSI